MHQSVEMSGRLLYLLSHVVVTVEVEHVGDKIQSILIVLYLGVEAGKVKSVREIFFVDLAEVFVAS